MNPMDLKRGIDIAVTAVVKDVEPTFPRSKARWRASEREIALWAVSEQHQKAGFLPEPTPIAGRPCE
jgi:hypothetical protein